MKRALKIIGWTLAGIVLTVVAVVCVTCYVIFTPARLTPIAREAADQYITCEHQIGEVDLTFFSTFPYFGASLKGVYLINPKAGAQSDTLLAIPELLVSVKLLDAIKGDIFIKRFRLKEATANIYVAADGSTNYDVFVLPEDTVEMEEDTVPGWQLKSVGWDEDLAINARTLTFVDEKDTINASLYNMALALSEIHNDTLSGARLDLSAESVSANLKGDKYADNLSLRLRLPALLANGSERVFIDGAKLQINEFALELDGEVGTPCFSSGEYNMDVTLRTGKWQIKPLLALVPQTFTKSLSDLDVDGELQLDATARGTYSEKTMPLLAAHLVLDEGKGSYKPLPYTLRDMKLVADAELNLNQGQVSNVYIKSLSAKTKESRLNAEGRINDLLGDMIIDLQMALDANLPDFAYFMPEAMTLAGRAKGKANAKIRLSDLMEMRLHKGKINADLMLTDIHYAMDGMVADLPKTHAVLQLPNSNPSKPKVNWARINLETDKLDFAMATPLTAKLKASSIQLESGNVVSDDPVLYAAVGLQSERPLEVAMDSMGGTIDAPKLTAYAEYNTKDTTVMPVLQATVDCDALDGFFKDIQGELKQAQLKASLSGGRKDKSAPRFMAKLDTKTLNARMGEELKAKTGVLSLEAGARYNKDGANMLLQWNPRLKINLKNGEMNMPDRLPEPVYIPSIEFSYSNREMTIDNSRVELGNSDLNLQGHVKNIGKWFRHEDILVGELDIVSNYCDANQLLAWFSADNGSEEQSNSQKDGQAQSDSKPLNGESAQTSETDPFLVPTDVDLALNTHMKEVVIFNQNAKDLKGGIFVKDGTLILDEVGFVCRAAKLQLTGMYRTPRRNHLYLGFDYHMIDVDIDELLSMIPDLEEMVPMLSSFKGAAEFHLAAETYLNSQYQPKMSTLRGAASLTGKDLVVLDSETFSKISKLLMFNKKTENKIDSINAELTIYKNEIDIYPLCVQMDNYMVALGGRHNTDMTFDYDINVLSPIYLGVNVGGNMDNLKIKLAKCKFAKDFRPRWFDKTDTQSKELRERIKQSMEKNVRIK